MDRSLSRNFRLDLAAGMLGATFFAGSFMPVLVRRMGGSELEVALVMAAGPIGNLVAPLFAYWYARVAPSRVVAATNVAARLVFLASLVVATSAFSLALAWVAFNVVALSSIASSARLVQSIYPDEQRATAMARVRMMANLVGMGSTLAGGAFLTADDPRVVLALAAAVSVCAPLFFLFMRYDHVAPAVILSPLRLGAVAVRDTAFRRYLIATTFIGFGNAIGGTVYPILLVDRFDAPSTLVGLLAATQAAATIAGYHFWGRRIDRGSTVVLVRGNALVMTLLPVTYLVAPNAMFLLLGAVVAGVTTAMMELAFFTSIIELAGPRAEQYMAAQSFVLGVRATLAPFVACALLLAVGPQLTLVGVVACLVAGAYLARGVRPTARTIPLPAMPSGALALDGD